MTAVLLHLNLPRYLSKDGGKLILLYLAIIALALYAGGRMLTDWCVTRADARAARDPKTGLLAGAEPRDLGPLAATKAVLFVHGFVGTGNNFADLPDRLAAKNWFVRVMRLPGHGTSPRDFVKTTPDELYSAVASELKALKSRYAKVVLVGHSMGGAFSSMAVAQEGADGLVLGAPYFGVTHRWYYGLRPETWLQIAGPFLPWVYKGKLFLQVNREEAKDQIVCYQWIPIHGMQTLVEIGRRANALAILSKITCPVLLIHSQGDVAASPAAARHAFEKMASKNKHAVLLSTSNHHLFWDYEREQVMKEVETFLETL